MDLFRGESALFYWLAVLIAFMAAEALIPWRGGVKASPVRWLRNASMTFYGSLIVSLIPLLSVFAAALTVEASGFGLFNLWTVPLALQMIAALVIFDFLGYAEHRILHQWYFFWRAHRTHHADTHIDATTSLRFHPLEILFRAVFEVPFVLALGLPPEGVLIAFGVHIVLNTLTHSNLFLPLPIERAASLVFITPRMHRLHHSTDVAHQFSNFATMFSFWDRMFGTMNGPEKLRDDEVFGIEGPEQIAPDSFANLALDPFRSPPAGAIPKPAPSERNDARSPA